MPQPEILLTIAARGGSKGVKNKNVYPILGKPLIAHTIAQALAWGRARHVVVSTDSPRIAQIAREHGALVPFMRPVELASDTAGKVPVIRHALVTCENIFDCRYDVVVDLDVTAPVRTIADLDACLKIYLNDKPNTILSVVPAHRNPYFNMLEVDERGGIKICKRPKKKLVRRQDAPAVYDANASIYFYRRDYLVKSKKPSLTGSRGMIYLMPEVSGFDIDCEVDLKFLEFLVKEGVVSL